MACSFSLTETVDSRSTIPDTFLQKACHVYVSLTQLPVRFVHSVRRLRRFRQRHPRVFEFDVDLQALRTATQKRLLRCGRKQKAARRGNQMR